MVYRAPGLVIVPLLTIFASLVVATGLVASLAQWSAQSGWLDYKIFKTTKIFIVVILYGAGTDFCLFLISRYKEELQRGLRPAEAIARALGRVGGAVTASAMTTVLGLGVMALCQFGKFRNSGPTIAIGLLVALAASLTLAPGLLRAAGPIVFWPWKRSSRRAKTSEVFKTSEVWTDRAKEGLSLFSRFWEWLSRQVIARPGLILVGSLIVLSPLAYQGLGVEVTYDLLKRVAARPAQRPGDRAIAPLFLGGRDRPDHRLGLPGRPADWTNSSRPANGSTGWPSGSTIWSTRIRRARRAGRSIACGAWSSRSASPPSSSACAVPCAERPSARRPRACTWPRRPTTPAR